jgi:hypothetical protein
MTADDKVWEREEDVGRWKSKVEGYLQKKLWCKAVEGCSSEKNSKLAVSSKVRFLRLQARRGGRSEKKLSLAGIAVDDILDFDQRQSNAIVDRSLGERSAG